MNRTSMGHVIFLLLIALIAPSSHAETISACGLIHNRHGCNVFVPFSGTIYGEYLLPDTVSAAYETEFNVTGDIAQCQVWCSNWFYLYCMSNLRFSECQPETLGCGVLGALSECFYWAPLDPSEPRIGVPDLFGFALGDTVLAIGIPNRKVSDWCCSCGTLMHAEFVSCTDSATAQHHLSWGRVRTLFKR